MKQTATLLLLFCVTFSFAQDKKPFSISGTIGVSYEHYGLNKNPSSWTGFYPRKPWNQVRFTFAPEIKFGKNFSLPLNINLATKATNFAGPYSGIGKQTFAQYISNPMNTIGANPKYKWAELQLGTQYLNYSNLSTGDIGVFGAGFDLRPNNFLIKFFTGLSQQSVNFFTGPPATTGAYKRRNWMFQFGKAEEGKYEVTMNFVKAKDVLSSLILPPPTVKPQEGFTYSFVTKATFFKNWYVNVEGARSIYTKNLLTPLDSANKSFKPFISAHTSTVSDYAASPA